MDEKEREEKNRRLEMLKQKNEERINERKKKQEEKERRLRELQNEEVLFYDRFKKKLFKLENLSCKNNKRVKRKQSKSLMTGVIKRKKKKS